MRTHRQKYPTLQRLNISPFFSRLFCFFFLPLFCLLHANKRCLLRLNATNGLDGNFLFLHACTYSWYATWCVTWDCFETMDSSSVLHLCPELAGKHMAADTTGGLSSSWSPTAWTSSGGWTHSFSAPGGGGRRDGMAIPRFCNLKMTTTTTTTTTKRIKINEHVKTQITYRKREL